MTRSNHLWPDPAPDIEWEVWSEDTFDREARMTQDAGGKGLVDGVKALWIRFLLETVRPEGWKGFTRFYLRRNSPVGVPIKGPWEGAVRLRSWIFGTKTRAYRGRLEAADRQLFEAITHIHALLLLQERSSEPILTMAAEAADRRDFTTRLEEMARPWGIALDQTTLTRVRSLKTLVEFKDRQVRDIRKRPVPKVKKRSRRRLFPDSWKKTLRQLDSRLLGAVLLLFFGLFFLAVFGRRFSLTCTRIESNQVECIHHGSWLGLITFKRQPVDGLWRARVQQICDSDGCVAFPELDTAEDPVKLSDGSSSNSTQEIIIVEKINTFLGDPSAQELEVVVDIRLSKLIVPVVMILGGLILFGLWIIKLLR